MEQPDNPLAFPVPGHGHHTFPRNDGMTLRDYVAARVASVTLEMTSKVAMRPSEKYGTAARMAYDMADAMLAERERAT